MKSRRSPQHQQSHRSLLSSNSRRKLAAQPSTSQSKPLPPTASTPAPSEFRQSAPLSSRPSREAQAESAESTSPIFEDHHEAVVHCEPLHHPRARRCDCASISTQEVVELSRRTTSPPSLATGEMLSARTPSSHPPLRPTLRRSRIAHRAPILSQPDLIAEEINSSGRLTFSPRSLSQKRTLGRRGLPHHLHASSIEEMDDFDEEETLEGAADLGTMIREMSIDQITRPATMIVEEDDDLEEEDSSRRLRRRGSRRRIGEEEDSEPIYDEDEQAEEDVNRDAGFARTGSEIPSNGSTHVAAPRIAR